MHIFKMAAQNLEFDIITELFFWQCFYQKSLLVCPKMVLPLQCMVLAAIRIIIPGYYRILGDKRSFSVYNHI